MAHRTHRCAVWVASALVGVFSGASAAATDELNDRLTAGKESAAAALAKILESPGSVNSVSLFIASEVAIENGKLLDAGYLFYLAQLRGKADLASFPPTETGVNSPEVALGALHEKIGTFINPPLMRDRRGYALVLERLRKSKPDYGPAYSPGWKFETRAASPEAEATFSELRSSLLEYMTNMKSFLDDERAYQALLVMQVCPLANDPASPDCDAKHRSAEEELRAAERRHDLEGFFGF